MSDHSQDNQFVVADTSLNKTTSQSEAFVAKPVIGDPKIANLYINGIFYGKIPTLYGILCEDKELIEKSKYINKLTGCFAVCILKERKDRIFKMGLRLMKLIVDAYAQDSNQAEVFRNEVIRFIDDLPDKLRHKHLLTWNDISTEEIIQRIIKLNVNYFFLREMPQFKKIRAFKLFARTTDPLMSIIKLICTQYRIKPFKKPFDFWSYLMMCKTTFFARLLVN